nr:hypothetical protein [Tanacetum cinerariifolium]
MMSFDYRLNPLYPIKECSSYGTLYTTDYCCSEGSLGDKIICDLDKIPDLSQRSPQNCPKCGNPDDGHYCQGCALLRKKFKEDLFAYCIENEILQDSSEPSYDNTNIVNALREPFVVNQDPGPFNNQTVDELPQTPPCFDPTCYSEDGNSLTCDSTSNLVQDSPNVFSPPLQPPIYSHEFCGNDAYYSQDCSLQVPFTYDPEPSYNQDFNFPQNFQTFQQYPCCTRCGAPHETCQCNQLIFGEPYCENYEGPHMNFQCQPMNQNHYEPNPCYDSNSFGFDQFQPPQFPIIHQPIRKKTYAELLAEEQEANIDTQSFQYSDRPIICYDDDDEDYDIAFTPSLSTEEPDNSLSMGDGHLDTVPAMKSDEFIKSNVENLVPIPSESEGIPDNMCDVPFHDNSPSLDVSKDQFEDFSDFNDKSTSTDDDSFSIDNIKYVEASPPNSKLVSLEVMEMVIPKVEGIDDDILLTIQDDILREKLLNINLFIANIEALNDNPTPYSDFITKSSSTSLNS